MEPGTRFEIDEARKINETGLPLPARNEDSHDILGTYKLVSDRREMALIAGTGEEFLAILRRRHKTLLGARRDANPGLFKDRNKVAGGTSFVDKELVQGTWTGCSFTWIVATLSWNPLKGNWISRPDLP
ncbi:MAG: hypothetical protein V2B15_17025 [Bacteroidota bacterium]